MRKGLSMKLLKTMIMTTAMSMLAHAGDARAHAGAEPAPAQTPAGSRPRRRRPPTPRRAGPRARPPAPFPEGAKFAFIDIQAIASNSAEGQGGDREARRAAQEEEHGARRRRQASLKAMQDKLQSGGSVLNDAGTRRSSRRTSRRCSASSSSRSRTRRPRSRT